MSNPTNNDDTAGCDPAALDMLKLMNLKPFELPTIAPPADLPTPATVSRRAKFLARIERARSAQTPTTVLTDAQWALIVPLLPLISRQHKSTNIRGFIDFVLWRAGEGIAWTGEITHYVRFKKWAARRIWPALLDTLREEDPTFEYAWDEVLGDVVYAPQAASGAATTEVDLNDL